MVLGKLQSYMQKSATTLQFFFFYKNVFKMGQRQEEILYRNPNTLDEAYLSRRSLVKMEVKMPIDSILTSPPWNSGKPQAVLCNPLLQVRTKEHGLTVQADAGKGRTPGSGIRDVCVLVPGLSATWSWISAWNELNFNFLLCICVTTVTKLNYVTPVEYSYIECLSHSMYEVHASFLLVSKPTLSANPHWIL